MTDRSRNTARFRICGIFAAVLLALPALAVADEHDVALRFRESIPANPSSGQTGDTIEFSITLNPATLGERIEHLAEYLRVQSFMVLGLDPYVPVREQFLRTDTYYIPVAGYEKLKPETVAFFMYHMFGKTFDAMTTADAAARDLAADGVRNCDKSLVLQAVADLRIVLGVYKERLTHARDIKGMNEHQLAYYASELGYLMAPDTDSRYVGFIPVPGKYNVGTRLDDYLGIEVSRFRIMTGTADLENVLDEVERRRSAIETLDAKVAALIPYIESSIAVVSANIARLETIAAGM